MLLVLALCAGIGLCGAWLYGHFGGKSAGPEFAASTSATINEARAERLAAQQNGERGVGASLAVALTVLLVLALVIMATGAGAAALAAVPRDGIDEEEMPSWQPRTRCFAGFIYKVEEAEALVWRSVQDMELLHVCAAGWTFLWPWQDLVSIVVLREVVREKVPAEVNLVGSTETTIFCNIRTWIVADEASVRAPGEKAQDFFVRQRMTGILRYAVQVRTDQERLHRENTALGTAMARVFQGVPYRSRRDENGEIINGGNPGLVDMNNTCREAMERSSSELLTDELDDDGLAGRVRFGEYKASKKTEESRERRTSAQDEAVAIETETRAKVKPYVDAARELLNIFGLGGGDR